MTLPATRTRLRTARTLLASGGISAGSLRLHQPSNLCTSITAPMDTNLSLGTVLGSGLGNSLGTSLAIERLNPSPIEFIRLPTLGLSLGFSRFADRPSLRLGASGTGGSGSSSGSSRVAAAKPKLSGKHKVPAALFHIVHGFIQSLRDHRPRRGYLLAEHELIERCPRQADGSYLRPSMEDMLGVIRHGYRREGTNPEYLAKLGHFLNTLKSLGIEGTKQILELDFIESLNLEDSHVNPIMAYNITVIAEIGTALGRVHTINPYAWMSSSDYKLIIAEYGALFFANQLTPEIATLAANALKKIVAKKVMNDDIVKGAQAIFATTKDDPKYRDAQIHAITLYRDVLYVLDDLNPQESVSSELGKMNRLLLFYKYNQAFEKIKRGTLESGDIAEFSVLIDNYLQLHGKDSNSYKANAGSLYSNLDTIRIYAKSTFGTQNRIYTDFLQRVALFVEIMNSVYGPRLSREVTDEVFELLQIDEITTPLLLARAFYLLTTGEFILAFHYLLHAWERTLATIKAEPALTLPHINIIRQILDLTGQALYEYYYFLGFIFLDENSYNSLRRMLNQIITIVNGEADHLSLFRPLAIMPGKIIAGALGDVDSFDMIGMDQEAKEKPVEKREIRAKRNPNVHFLKINAFPTTHPMGPWHTVDPTIPERAAQLVEGLALKTISGLAKQLGLKRRLTAEQLLQALEQMVSETQE